jgi:hypothetical protein
MERSLCFEPEDNVCLATGVFWSETQHDETGQDKDMQEASVSSKLLLANGHQADSRTALIRPRGGNDILKIQDCKPDTLRPQLRSCPPGLSTSKPPTNDSRMRSKDTSEAPSL